jgi:hypothetical protein
VRLALTRLAAQETEPRRVVIPARLVLRASSERA